MALAEQGALEQALAAYWRAIEVRPRHAAAYYNLGNALRRLRRYDEAVRTPFPTSRRTRR